MGMWDIDLSILDVSWACETQICLFLMFHGQVRHRSVYSCCFMDMWDIDLSILVVSWKLTTRSNLIQNSMVFVHWDCCFTVLDEYYNEYYETYQNRTIDVLNIPVPEKKNSIKYMLCSDWTILEYENHTWKCYVHIRPEMFGILKACVTNLEIICKDFLFKLIIMLLFFNFLLWPLLNRTLTKVN